MPSTKSSADNNTLTYFEPPKDEKPQSSSNVLSVVFNFFSLKKDQKSIKDAPEKENVNSSVRPNMLDLDKQKQGTKRKMLPALPHDRGSEVELRLRSLSSMLKDFPKLMKGPQNSETLNAAQGDISPNPSTSELRQYWMPDDQCHECYDCGEKFTTFRRRHHCRICGQIFCSRCCNQLISGKIMGYPGTLRSCTYCCELVLTLAEGNAPRSSFAGAFSQQPSTSDTSMDDSIMDGQPVSDNVLSFGNSHSTTSNTQGLVQSSSNTSMRRPTQTFSASRHDTSVTDDQFFPAPRTSFDPLSIMSPGRDLTGRRPVYIFDATPDMVTPSVLGPDVKDDLVQDSTQLHTLWRKIIDEKHGIEFRDHRFRLRKYSSCVTGQELVDWFLRNDVASTRAQGCAIGQALYEGKWIKSAVDAGRVFQDGYVLYRDGNKSSTATGGACIEIYPDHFANFSDEGNNDGLHTLANREPIWVQEIKCEDEDDDIDGQPDEFYEGISESDLTWSDAQNTHNESSLYSDEDKSISEKSVVSFSSFVEIEERNEGNHVIKYTRPTSYANSSFSGQQRNNMHSPQPSYDDSHLTSISADYLRSFLTWNGTYLAQPWITPSSGWRESDLQSSLVTSRDKRAYQWLREMYLRHDLAFLKQLLHEKGLDLTWAEVLVPLAKHAAENVTPNPNVCIDICHYVQIKKVPDGPKKNSEVLNGVVCTKNVVHKQMQSDIMNPSILLLAIPLEYHRVQLKLSALDPIVRQEREFYKHLISRITTRQPKVILVQCTVSHIAQELLLQAGITLVINVKPSVMERVARSTEADIVYSIDQLLQAKLGHCARFYVEHHTFPIPTFPKRHASLTSNIKTLMYFDGCNPRFGCTVLLRGSGDDMPTYKHTTTELTLVQDVFRFLVRAMFHARLELSYLIDQHDFGKLLKKSGSTKHHSYEKTSEVEGSAVISERPKSIQCNEEQIDTDINDSKDDFNKTVVNKKPILVPLAAPANSNKNCIQPPKVSLSHSNSAAFKESLELTLLTFSPLIQPRMPFLFAGASFDSPIYKYLPEKLFWSRAFELKSMSKSEFSSSFESEQRQSIRSRTSTMESSTQDKLWLTAPQNFNKNLNSTDYEDSTTSVETLGNSMGSRETLEEGTLQPIVRKQRLDPNASCYSQQYKTYRDVDGVSASYNAVKLHTWEQKMMDQIFGPPPPERIIPEFPSIASTKPVLKRIISKKQAESDANLCEKGKADKLSMDLERNAVDYDTSSLHQFLTQPLTASVSSIETRDLLASFRAHAGMIPVKESPKEDDTSTHIEVIFSENHLDHEEEDNAKNVTFDKIVDSFSFDCMDPANHQHIYAVFSSYSPQSPNAPYFCVLPWVVDIDFYRGNDITLGGFLERYCFRPSYHCPNATCRRPMVEHIRSFVHGNMCMTVVLKELSKPFRQSSILTWNWDYETRKSSDIKAMSHDAWCMSFANYLELNLEKMSVPDLSSTNDHQKHKDVNKHEILDEEWELKPFTSFQYFMFRDIVAAFKCYSVNINEVVFPSPELKQASNNHTFALSNELDENITTYEDFILAVESLEEKLTEVCETIQDCLHSSHTNKSMSDSPNEELLKSRNGFYSDCLNTLIEEKKHLLDEIGFLKYLLQSYQTPHSAEDVLDVTLKNDSWGEERFLYEESNLPNDLVQQLSIKILQLKCEICELVQTWNEKLVEAYEKNRSSYWASNKTKTESPQNSIKRSCDSIDKILEEAEPTEQEAAGGSVLGEDVSSVAMDTNVSVKIRKLDDKHFIVNSVDMTHATEISDVVEKRPPQKLKRGVSTENRIFERSTSYKRLSRTGSSVRLLVTKLLPGNALVQSIPLPYPADEHFLLPECLTANVVVRDAEPASIIAYTLSLKAYKSALSHTDGVGILDSKVETEQLSRDSSSSVERKHHSPKLSIGSNQPEFIDFPVEEAPDITVLSMSSSSSTGPSDSPHFETQFCDSTTKFYCKVYFASLFQKLRSKVLADGEAQYLSSMSRSIRWLARGGKSGSTFHKTRDDQFILKQMSYFELQSFLEFAPKYFDYITNCIDNQEATTISKILGVYRISFRNSETNKSLKQDVLVIENLFYQRKVGQIFDLKGSVRNRHAKADVSNLSPDSSSHADHNDIVLLDENFLKMMCDNPIYVHEHTKHLLTSAITRDTNFLSKNLIMDYSLLVGIEENNQIVVGIIDFIRTFTWDKKLEMVVKSYGMLGGRKQTNKTMPTVVSPELYKKRFCEAMDRYFQVVPDRWYGMHTF